MQRFGSSGFLYYLMFAYAVIAVVAMVRKAKRPENVKMQAGEGMRVGPMSTPVAAQAMAKEN
jgi:hypothetical protein